uniref:Uncharacterized protein n=1 Tax=Rhizophora mucronata TaxID=61149 RepID=A0A2P2QDF5_RHIMU
MAMKPRFANMTFLHVHHM